MDANSAQAAAQMKRAQTANAPHPLGEVEPVIPWYVYLVSPAARPPTSQAAFAKGERFSILRGIVSSMSVSN